MKKLNSRTFWVIFFLLALNLLSFWFGWLKWVESIIYGFCLGMIMKEMSNDN